MTWNNLVKIVPVSCVSEYQVNILSRHNFFSVAFLAAIVVTNVPADAGDNTRSLPHHYWQGGYFGPALSLYKLKNNYNPAKPIGIQKLNAKGKLIGLVAGYNFSNKDYLYGLEADISNGSVFNDDLAFISTLRARVGKPVQYTLPYLTGGLAVAGLKKSAANRPLEASNAQIGYAIGAGVEQVLANAISGRLEYTYSQFFSKGSSNQPSVRLKNLHMFKASLVIHLNN